MSQDELSQKLNLETGRITWPELQRYFARGVIIIVTAGVDLVETAAAVSQDDREIIENLIGEGKITRANDDHARQWQEEDPLFWAVVVAPWVLVQKIET